MGRGGEGRSALGHGRHESTCINNLVIWGCFAVHIDARPQLFSELVTQYYTELHCENVNVIFTSTKKCTVTSVAIGTVATMLMKTLGLFIYKNSCVVIIMYFSFLTGSSVHSICCVELCRQMRLESCLKIASPLLQCAERCFGSAEIGRDGSNLLLGATPGRPMV